MSKTYKDLAKGMRIRALTGNTDNYPVRYVVTAIHAGATHRTIVGPAQGRNTHGTFEEAAQWIQDCLANSPPSALAMFNNTLEVRAVRCYPGHWDPVHVVWPA